MRRGELYWHRFGRPDKRRPVVVLTRSGLLPHLGTATVAAVTSTVRSVPTQVPVGPPQGLPKASAINLHHVFTIPRSEIGPYIATLTDEIMTRVDAALVLSLGVGERSASGEQ